MKKLVLLAIVILSLSICGCENKDNTPPTIMISSPAEGKIVSGVITIKTETADNDGISRVEFFLDDYLFSTVSQEPFQTVWDTEKSTDGEHTLYCKAIDFNDNETKSKSISVTASNKLFTAKFTNDWLCADCGEGILFASDMDGNVLAEATWTGNKIVELKVPEGLTDIPQKISVTTVTSSDYIFNLTMVSIITHLSIDVGAIWTFKNYPEPNYDNPTNVMLNFQNTPDHHGYALATLWTYDFSSYGSLFNNSSQYIYESPMDMYLKLNVTNSTPKYTWINNMSGGSYQIDLSNMEETESKTIDLQGSPEVVEKYLYGYINPGKRYEGNYIIDYEGVTNVSSVNVHYPPSDFSEFRTSLYFYDTESDFYYPSYWYQTVYGDIPKTFEKVDADFEIVNDSPNDFNISTTSKNFDEIRSEWVWVDGSENYAYAWFVQSPPDLSNYSLPILPNSVIEKYTGINRESFSLNSVDLRDHSELNSYEELLDIIYNSPDNFYDVVNDLRLRHKVNINKKSNNDNSIDFEGKDVFIDGPQYKNRIK